MKRNFWFASYFLAACFSHCAILETSVAGTLEQPVQRSIYFRYGVVKTPRFVEKQNREKQKRFLESVADILSVTVRLPSPIVLVREECGESTAFYNRDSHEIILCYELDEELDRLAIKKFGERQQVSVRASLFVLYHELGHAEVNLYDLPITGREEDVADQLATYTLLNIDPPSMMVPLIEAAMWFFSETSLAYTREHFADVHSLNPQRQFNILCWAYGKDQESFAALVKKFSLPVQRAQRCQNEYAQLAKAVNVMRLRENEQTPGGTPLYVQKAEVDRAIQDFTEAIRRGPKTAAAYINRGLAYAQRGIAYGQKADYDLAIQDFTEAIRIDPGNASTYVQRGSVSTKKADYDRAIQDFTEAIRIDPQNGGAYHGRGSAYALKKTYDLAIQDFTEAIRINPNDAAAYRLRGLAYRRKGDHNRAIQDKNEADRIEAQLKR